MPSEITRDPNPRSVDVKSCARQRGVERFIALGQGAARGEARIERTLDANDAIDRQQFVDSSRVQPALPPTQLRNRELDLQSRVGQEPLSLRSGLFHSHIDVYADLGRACHRSKQETDRRHDHCKAQEVEAAPHGPRLLEPVVPHFDVIPSEVARHRAQAATAERASTTR